MEKTWLTILNPYAGSGKTMSVWMKAENILLQHDVPFEVRSTESGYNVRNLALRGAQEGFRRIIGVGGDGTIHDIVHGILDYLAVNNAAKLSDFTIAVIPFGSGNDWLKSLGVKHKDLNTIIGKIADGNVRKQDIGKITILETGETFPIVNVAGAGFDARVCEIVNDEKQHGVRRKMIYFQVLLKMLRTYKGMNLKILCDGETIHEGPCYTMSFGNGIYSGGGLRQTPDAIMDDGLLDVSFVPKITFGLVVKVLPKLFSDSFNKKKGVVAARGKSFEVYPLDEVSIEKVEADGEVIGNLPARLEILPEQINVIA